MIPQQTHHIQGSGVITFDTSTTSWKTWACSTPGYYLCCMNMNDDVTNSTNSICDYIYYCLFSYLYMYIYIYIYVCVCMYD